MSMMTLTMQIYTKYGNCKVYGEFFCSLKSHFAFIVLSMMSAMAPSPVTLQAVPKLSMAM